MTKSREKRDMGLIKINQVQIPGLKNIVPDIKYISDEINRLDAIEERIGKLEDR